MALELPPRRSRGTAEVTIQRKRSSLDVLMQMGFTKARAEKALAATGDKGVQLASDWLLSHVNDPTLDEVTPREYILYLCPVGQQQQQFLSFWKQSYSQAGWNRAHNIFPHITLCSFFKADDSQATPMAHALKSITERISNVPNALSLEYFASPNFIGLFVSESCAPFLKRVTQCFADEIKMYGVNMEPHKKQLHISLAYQFPPENRDKLEALAKCINLDAPVRWDLRLYSRDPRVANCQVRWVVYPHTPQAHDELELIHGDFCYVEHNEIEESPDGWYKGASWLTGVSGFIPGNYTERTAESETWTMHRSIPIMGTENIPPNTGASGSISQNLSQMALVDHMDWTNVPGRRIYENGPVVVENILYTQFGEETSASKDIKLNVRPKTRPVGVAQIQQSSVPVPSSSTSVPSGGAPGSPKAQRHKIPSSQMPVNKHGPATSVISQGATVTQAGRTPHSGDPPTLARIPPSSRTETFQPPRPQGPRQLYVIRHGERVDFTFGKDWIQMSFDQAGNYIRHDLNMPRTLPKRKNGPGEFQKDSPLTVQGQFQATIIGEALREKDVPIGHIYTSPSLRCVETATSILEGMGICDIEIHIEPGLFEWLGWYQSGLPKFMTQAEMKDNGFKVCQTDVPIWPVNKFNMKETTEQYYERCHSVTKEILKRHRHEGGNVMIIAHAASLDVCTRQLVGLAPRNHADFHDVLHKIPYLAMAVCQEDCIIQDKWAIVEPPVLAFAHTNNPKYNWAVLTSHFQL